MANLVIKPASGSGNKIVFQNQAGLVDAITIEDSGNTTLAGTANNLGTVTAGTLGPNIVMPDRVLFDYNLLSTATGYTLNTSGTNAGLGGFTGTLTYASEIHVLKFNCFRGGTQSSQSGDGENFSMAVVSSATPTTTNGLPTNSLLPDFNKNTSQHSFYLCDVPVATNIGTYGDAYNFYNQDAMTYATVTGTAGVTAYAYYPWFFNQSSANSYLGRSKSDPGRCSKTVIEFWRYTV